MKAIWIAVIVILLAGLPARAVDVVIDLGEVGTLTISDTTVAGVSIVACMKAVMDRYQPPLVNEQTGQPIPWTNAQYKAILIDYIAQRGKAQLNHAVQAEFNSRLVIPQVRDHVTLTARE
jgi:hypothetical protein